MTFSGFLTLESLSNGFKITAKHVSGTLKSKGLTGAQNPAIILHGENTFRITKTHEHKK
jgi:hypothetical protein